MIFLFILNAIIHGKVIDLETSHPIRYCNVYLENTGLGTATDSMGRYIIRNVPTGVYKLVFSHIGYETVERHLTVGEHDTITMNVQLKRSIIPLYELTVGARREHFTREISTGTYRIYHAEVTHTPYFIGPDLVRVLMMLPGMTTVTDFSTLLFVRGGRPDENAILLDGIPVFNPQHFGGLFSVFDPKLIHGVDLYTSGFPAIYGGKLSSIIDIKTEYPQQTTCDVEVTGLATTISVSHYISSYLAYVMFVRRTYFDKILPLFGYRFPYYFYDFFVKPIFRIGNSTVSMGTFLTNDCLAYKNDVELNLSWQNKVFYVQGYEPKPDYYLQWNVGYSGFDLIFGFEDIVSRESKVYEGVFKLHYTRKVNNVKLDYGMELVGDRFYHDEKVGGISYRIDRTTFTAMMFVNLTRRKDNIWVFQPGLRLNLFHNGDRFYPTLCPRLAIKRFVTEDIAVTLATGYYTQFYVAPVPKEVLLPPFINNWMPIVGRYKPERAIHVVVGIESWSNNRSLSIEGYCKYYPYVLDMREMKEIDLDDWQQTLFHEGRAIAYGVDLMLRRFTGNVRGWVSYSLAWIKYYLDTLAYFPAHDKRHNLKFVAILKGPWKLKLVANFVLSSGSPYTGIVGRWRQWFYDERSDKWVFIWRDIKSEYNALRYPMYHRLDVNLTRGFRVLGKDMELSINFINVYNRKNVFLYYYDYSKEPPPRRELHMLPFFVSIGITGRLW